MHRELVSAGYLRTKANILQTSAPNELPPAAYALCLLQLQSASRALPVRGRMRCPDGDFASHDAGLAARAGWAMSSLPNVLLRVLEAPHVHGDAGALCFFARRSLVVRHAREPGGTWGRLCIIWGPTIPNNNIGEHNGLRGRSLMFTGLLATSSLFYYCRAAGPRF